MFSKKNKPIDSHESSEARRVCVQIDGRVVDFKIGIVAYVVHAAHPVARCEAVGVRRQ